MRISEAKQKLDEIIGVLSEDKLKEVIDFACYLKSKKETEELFGMADKFKSLHKMVKLGKRHLR